MALEREVRDLKRLPPVVENIGLKLEGDPKSEAKGAGARLPGHVPLLVPAEDDGPLMEVAYQTWEIFQGADPAINRMAVVKVLLGEPGIPKKLKRGSAAAKRKGMVTRKASEPRVPPEVALESKAKLPNRIRCVSDPLGDCLDIQR